MSHNCLLKIALDIYLLVASLLSTNITNIIRVSQNFGDLPFFNKLDFVREDYSPHTFWKC